MKTEELTDLQQMIALWKEKGIVRGEFVFQCGGDQMNDTEIHFYNDKNEEVDCPELEDYIDGEIYNQVEFYVNSDGHYQGEAGVVTIELNDDDEDEDFTYSKSSESEWNESFDTTTFFELTKEEFEFFKDYVHSIVGGTDGNRINYKRDSILNDDQVEVRDEILSRIEDFACDYDIEDADGEFNEWYNYSTNLEESNYEADDYEYDESNPSLLKVIDGKYFVAVYISKSYTIYKEEDN
jgi:hypothetical protein